METVSLGSEDGKSGDWGVKTVSRGVRTLSRESQDGNCMSGSQDGNSGGGGVRTASRENQDAYIYKSGE